MEQPGMFPSTSRSSTESNTSLGTASRARDKLGLLPDPGLFDNGLSEKEIMQWVEYLYANPRPGTKRLNLRNRVIALYDPFARRKVFPAGRRWCVNVYAGCAYACKYCYIIGYVKDAFRPRVKKGFQKQLARDLSDLARLSLCPAPIHISNSSDPLQPLEAVHRNTLFLLQQIQEHEHRFTTITILTKNPTLLCTAEYMRVLQALSRFQVEVTCPFYRDEPRRAFEWSAPRIRDRLEAIKALREHGIKVALRMDPLFPRNPLPKEFFEKSTLDEYGAPECQTENDIGQLIRFASDVGCTRIVVSPLKLTIGRLGKSKLLGSYEKLYAASNNGTLMKRGSAYRLPWALYQHWIEQPTNLARSLGIPLVTCRQNLFTTH